MLAASVLVVVMAFGSLMLWTGLPLGWLWLASQLQEGTTPQFRPYLVVIFGLPISMALVAIGLGRLDRRLSRLLGREDDRRAPLPWHKSMRAERGSRHRSTVLDFLMMGSLTIAVAAAGVWFFFFAHPGAPAA